MDSIFANFPWRFLDLNLLEDLVFALRRNHLGNLEEAEEQYTLINMSNKFTTESVGELKSQLVSSSRKNSTSIKVKNLKFKIETKSWGVSFDGSVNRRKVHFYDRENSSRSKSQRQKFIDFWTKEIEHRYRNRKAWRLVGVSVIAEYYDLLLVFTGIFGELITQYTWEYQYSGNFVLYFPSEFLLMQIGYSVLPAVALVVPLIRIDIEFEKSEYIEKIYRSDFSVRSLLLSNFSAMLRIVLIPLSVLVYYNSIFLNIFPTLPHKFLSVFADVTPLEIVITLLIILLAKLIASFFRVQGLEKRRLRKPRRKLRD